MRGGPTTRRTVVAVALVLAACGDGAAPGDPPTGPSSASSGAVAAEDVDARVSLRGALVQRLDDLARAETNVCVSGRRLIAALRLAAPEARPGLHARIRALAQRLRPGEPNCVDWEELTALDALDEPARRAAVDRVLAQSDARLTPQHSLSPQVAKALAPDDLARLEAYAAEHADACVRARVGIAVAVRSVASAERAFGWLEGCPALSPEERLRLAPLLSAASRQALLAPERALLEAPASAWTSAQITALARSARHLDPGERDALLTRGLAEVPRILREAWNIADYPADHVLTRALRDFAPWLSAAQVPAALAAVPLGWSDEARAYALESLAASLERAALEPHLPAVLEAFPAGVLRVRAELMISPALAADRRSSLFARYLELEPAPLLRAEVAGRVFALSAGRDRAAYDALLVALDALPAHERAEAVEALGDELFGDAAAR